MGDQKEKNNDFVKKGIIGFFDILGYGSLLENNEPEEIYNEIYPILENIEEYFKSNLKVVKVSKGKKVDVKDKFKSAIDDVEWYVFSDTILITFNISKYTHEYRGYLWSIFLAACSMLQKNMFQKGLPLRGVINYGKYIAKKDFFAGKPIIEAYRISKELDLSACVMTSTASNVYYKNIEITEKSKRIRCALDPFLNYYIPKKENKRNRMDTLCAIVENCEEEEIRSKILESFGAHNKEINDSVNSKIDNTEEWLKYRKRNFDPKVNELKQNTNN